MKKWISASLLSLMVSMGMAQSNWCGFDAYHQQQLASDEAYRINESNFIENVHQRVPHLTQRDGDKIIVPTVVHVTYSDCSGNISEAQIKDALRVLNEDYARKNPDTTDTRAVFAPFADAGNIEFRLAEIDPLGNPTNGITRKQTSAAIDAQNNIKSIDYWNSSNYFNIWVVESIYNFTGGGGTILGYAQFPGSGSWSTYGIVIRNDAMGTIGTSTADGRTLTHEVGHCLGLYHTFQGACGAYCNSSGDYLCDTPPSYEATYDCNFAENTCSNDALSGSNYSSNVADQIENYMSYNSCQNMFTQDQMAVARGSFSQYSQLQTLVSQSNLEATGVVGLISADFETPTPVICEGTTINISQNAKHEADSFEWSFGANAVPATSTDEDPEVTFYAAGLQQVDFTMYDGNDSDSGSKPIFVVSNVGQFAPYTDEIDDVSETNNDRWFVENVDDDDITWELNTIASYSGENSYYIDNLGQCGQRNDRLYTQSFDLSTFTSATLQFKTAYAQLTGSENDFLRTYVSTDCGETWNLIGLKVGASLAGGTTPKNSAFIPDANDWNTQSVNLPSTYMVEGALFMFEFMSNGGNNIYFDDLKITGVFSGEQLLLSPVDGKDGLAADVMIDWKSAGTVSGYEYEVDTDPNFSSSNKISGTKTYLGPASDLADTEHLLEGLSVSTTYYWHVRNYHNGNNSDWSDTWSFTVSETGVGISEQAKAAEFKLVPNPANNFVQVVGTQDVNQYQIVDYTGRVISTVNGNKAGSQTLDVSSLNAGVYFIVISTTDNQSVVKSLVVN